MTALLNPYLMSLLSLLLLNDYIKLVSQEKVKLPIRKLIKIPLKFIQSLFAQPENLKSIVIGDDNYGFRFQGILNPKK